MAGASKSIPTVAKPQGQAQEDCDGDENIQPTTAGLPRGPGRDGRIVRNIIQHRSKMIGTLW